MKPAPFQYHRPASLDEAVQVLADVGADGKVLAGGQSLIPLLSMRLAAPGHLVDINRVPGLDAVAVGDGVVRVGALVRHSELLAHAGAGEAQPMLWKALQHVAHPTIRNRGTSVGSVCHADPAAELPAVTVLLGGTVVVRSVRGERRVPAAELFAGPLETTLDVDELAVAVEWPVLAERQITSFVEVSRRHGDYAMCGVAAVVDLEPDHTIRSARAAYVSVGATPPVVDLTDVVAGRPVVDLDFTAAADAAAEQLEPEADVHATADYRRQLARVLTKRALEEAV